ncbi:hypothetical protein DPMN_173294 [Dreissena polymorpha]|uniref:Uncharacterized protein n=1 Tax=Dreissena polymorpha TaxID=45954 RepID=A0A9D4IFY6_DREPO|nr:hypothetical protein DPMN_173294 [Dreissena polymorpha]
MQSNGVSPRWFYSLSAQEVSNREQVTMFIERQMYLIRPNGNRHQCLCAIVLHRKTSSAIWSQVT